MDGEGDIDWYFEKGIKQQSLINIMGMDTEFELELQKSKDKEFTRLFWNEHKISDFIALLFFFFRFVMRLKLGSSYRGLNYMEMIWRETKTTSS